MKDSKPGIGWLESHGSQDFMSISRFHAISLGFYSTRGSIHDLDQYASKITKSWVFTSLIGILLKTMHTTPLFCQRHLPWITL